MRQTTAGQYQLTVRQYPECGDTAGMGDANMLGKPGDPQIKVN